MYLQYKMDIHCFNGFSPIVTFVVLPKSSAKHLDYVRHIVFILTTMGMVSII